MVTVTVWGSLANVTGGKKELNIEAATIRELFRKLEEEYPGAKQYLDRGIEAAIDGIIYRDEWSKPLPKDSEVFLLPRLAGG